MGFCIFSNVAIAAQVARGLGYGKVAVIDFDVHHGNGTQAVFQTDPNLFFGSIHQWPLYPGTGAESETGVGNIVNAPVPPHAPRELWRRRFEDRLLPALDAFAPDLILIPKVETPEQVGEADRLMRELKVSNGVDRAIWLMPSGSSVRTPWPVS